MPTWKQIAAQRFPGYQIEGDGRWAFVMADFMVVRLSDWPMEFEIRPGYEAFRRIVELKPVQKVNTPRRSTSDPAQQEKD
jgi:hypothetical protein